MFFMCGVDLVKPNYRFHTTGEAPRFGRFRADSDGFTTPDGSIPRTPSRLVDVDVPGTTVSRPSWRIVERRRSLAKMRKFESARDGTNLALAARGQCQNSQY